MQTEVKQPPRRERLERGIFQRRTQAGEARYEFCYRDSCGRQRWGTRGSLKAARLARAELVSRVARGERVAPSNASFGDYADAWLRRQQARLRPSTYACYEVYLRLQLKPRFGPRRLQAISVDDVAALIGELQAGKRYREHDGRLLPEQGRPFAAWTIRGILVVLGRILGSAVREGLIASNPVRRLEKEERPQTERKQLPALDHAAIGRLIAATPARYRTLLTVSVLTGIRQSEALGLRWQDVDLTNGLIRIAVQLSRQRQLMEPKTKAAKRELPIPPSLVTLLQRHKQQAFERGHAKPSDLVFCSQTGGPLQHRNIVRRGLDQALETGGLPKLTWHDLRHVAASMMIAQGASVAYLARLLGHASPATTLNTYAHEFARAEHADRARQQMEAAFGALLL